MFLIPADYYQIKVTKKKGRGIFARREIPAGTIIGDYLGIVIKDEEADVLERSHGDTCYAMDYSDGLSVFPQDIKSIGIHLINHSCAPNCESYFYYGHTLYFTLRQILPGEELVFDYCFDPGEINERDLLYPCFCGSSFCRGTMYTSHNRLNRYIDFCRQQTKGQKFKPLAVGTLLAPLEKYPLEIKDNSIFNLFANIDKRPVSYDDKKLPALVELRKRLRSSGRSLSFKKLGISIIAIVDGRFIAEK